MGVYMAKSMRTWITELRQALKDKGYNEDIPYDVFCSEFWILSGYNKRTVGRWVRDFEYLKLIKINDNKVNFL